jgi:opacity protein-like surface antigen
MRRLHVITLDACFLLFLFLGMIGTRAHAQQQYTELKTAEISAFGGFTVTQPDISTYTDKGVSVGAAFTRFFDRLPVDPSVEIRGTYASGTYANERTVSFGIQLSRPIRRLHPYADFLVGVGSIVYAVDPAPGEHSDRGLAYTYGGGLDYDLVHNFRLRLDAQGQHWNLGQNPILAPDGGAYTLTPFQFTVGVNYVIPFRKHIESH